MDFSKHKKLFWNQFSISEPRHGQNQIMLGFPLVAIYYIFEAYTYTEANTANYPDTLGTDGRTHIGTRLSHFFLV